MQNQDLLLALGYGAIRRADHGSVYWALQHRHPDGRRWIEVGRFGSREVGRLALDAFVAAGHGRAEDFRVRKVHLPA